MKYYYFLATMFFLSMAAFSAGIVLNNFNAMVAAAVPLTFCCVHIAEEIFSKHN
jgi:hypothetical protein